MQINVAVELWKDSDDAFWIHEEGDIWYFWDEDEWQWLAPEYEPNKARRQRWHQASPLTFLVVTGENFYNCYEKGERVEEEKEYQEEDYSSQYNDEPY